MPTAAAECIAIIALIAAIGAATLGPARLPEAAVAAPMAGLLIAIGVVRPHAAADEIGSLGPTVGFLAAILVLAHLCDAEGVFAAAGRLMARRSRGEPVRLLGLVFVVASVITALLSLDATVVLLTPAVFATAARMRLRARPHVYACTHLANSASLLLPVSNLTNLLAFGASGLSFGRFAELMALPWLVVIAIEYAVFRRFFAGDLAHPATLAPAGTGPAPVFACVVVALTLVGFGVASTLSIAPVWVAAAGAAVLAVRALVRRGMTPVRVLAASNPLFCIFVLALAVIVRGVSDHGLAHAVTRILPRHDVHADAAGLLTMLLVALGAAVLANLINNLPATLLLLAPAVAGGHGIVLAMLIGVNVGPNLTYVGSLATLLWRRTLVSRGAEPAVGDFLRLGAAVVPLALVAAVAALWAALAVLPG